ncbi:MAG: signal peptide peptidase SppA [Myxococcales bacterium]|nr:signal peptide peptidase SppA [Myxococcales bacterium]MCB9671972.1 signal peptide peptidase SppA [Alphaproteobacteria bacterium]MCB9692730.1 signal peptide peptidase SppA [Alphaproteobacteria bacterium]
MAENAPPTPPKNRRATRILLLLTLGGAAVFLACVLFVVYLVTKQDTGTISDDTFVSVVLKGDIPDSPPPPDLFGDPNAPRMTATLYAESIRAAAADERVKGLWLRLDMPTAGWGRLQEVRSALVDFRASGKPCVAYSEMLDDASYYLASACDKVVLAPSGLTMVNGMAISQSYYRPLFEKIGVDAEFEHVGDFKSAVEPYELDGPSEAASEAMNYLLDGLWDQVVADIAAGRGMDPAAARQLLDHPPMSPHEALERGLIDALAFPDAVVARVHEVKADGWEASLEEPVTKELREAAEKRFTSLSEVTKKVRGDHRSKKQKIAVVYAEGPILSGKAEGGLFGSQVLADRTFRSWMKEVRDDSSVKAVVLRVNSPGGSGLASDMMWREIQLAKQQGLPVVVSMADYAASGGYFISAPADWIVAQPSTITGSIGVFGGKLNLAGTYEKLGVNLHTYKRGELADLFSSTAAFSDEGRATYKRFLADFYEIFLGKVVEGRKMDRDAVHAVAQGRVWTGIQAKERGLVDAIGGLDVAVAKAAELASLSDGDWGVSRWPREKDAFELLMEELQGGQKTSVQLELPFPLTEEAREQAEHLVLLERMLADGPVMLLPGDLTVD